MTSKLDPISTDTFTLFRALYRVCLQVNIVDLSSVIASSGCSFSVGTFSFSPGGRCPISGRVIDRPMIFSTSARCSYFYSMLGSYMMNILVLLPYFLRSQATILGSMVALTSLDMKSEVSRLDLSMSTKHFRVYSSKHRAFRRPPYLFMIYIPHI